MSITPAPVCIMFTTGPGPDRGDSKFSESPPHRPEKSGIAACSDPTTGETKSARESTAAIRICCVTHRARWRIRLVSLSNHPPLAKNEERPQSYDWSRSRTSPNPESLRLQVFVEPIQRVLPGFFGGGLVVTRRRVVVEAVIGALVDVTFMRHVVGRECRIKGLPSTGDALVELAILRIDRRLDLGSVFGAGLNPIEGNAGRHVRAHAHRQLIDDAAAEAEADDAELAGAVGTRFQPHSRGVEIFPHLGAIDLTEKGRALVVVSRIAAH